MPKRRSKQPATGDVAAVEVNLDKLEQFASGADSDEDIVKVSKATAQAEPLTSLEPVIREIIEPAEIELDPHANHDFKAIRLPMNRYYFDLLEKGARKERRSKLEFMRLAIEKAATEGL